MYVTYPKTLFFKYTSVPFGPLKPWVHGMKTRKQSQSLCQHQHKAVKKYDVTTLTQQECQGEVNHTKKVNHLRHQI